MLLNVPDHKQIKSKISVDTCDEGRLRLRLSESLHNDCINQALNRNFIDDNYCQGHDLIMLIKTTHLSNNVTKSVIHWS